jgi:hypothetical protein
MQFIQGCGALAALTLAVSSLAVPAQAQAPGKYVLSVVCRVSVSVKPSTGNLTPCRAGGDGLEMQVNAGDTVVFRAETPVASWTGCTVTPPTPADAGVSICTVKMTANKTVANTAPAVRPASTASPSQSGSGGSAHY